MYIPLQEMLSKLSIKPKGVIHVGCHWVEEHSDYVMCGIERFVYVEPCKEAYKTSQHKLYSSHCFENNINNISFSANLNETILLFNCACGAEEREQVPMYVSHQNQGQSNSLLRPELHLLQHPEVVFNDSEVVNVIPLDDLPFPKNKYDMLVMDVQGYEGEVLKGAEKTLWNIDIIYTEVNRGQTYKGNMEIGDLDELLWQEGFVRIETFWPSPNLTWGDAIYVKRKTLSAEDIDSL